MKKLGIVSGTVSLDDRIFESMETEIVQTSYGSTTVLSNGLLLYIPRHGMDPHHHILPHMINHAANIQALKALGASEIIGINSTGSLKSALTPGTLVVPDDFIALTPTPTIFTDIAAHVPPLLDEQVRERLALAARACGMNLLTTAVYWQTGGPRFETKAEIQMMAHYCDIVGMTMASEAVISCELEIPYAAICSVDNFAHGIGTKALSTDAVREGARKNAHRIAHIIKEYACTF